MRPEPTYPPVNSGGRGPPGSLEENVSGKSRGISGLSSPRASTAGGEQEGSMAWTTEPRFGTRKPNPDIYYLMSLGVTPPGNLRWRRGTRAKQGRTARRTQGEETSHLGRSPPPQ